MTRRNDGPRILISNIAAQRLAATLSRRKFLAISGGVAAAAALAACGSDGEGSPASTPAGGSSSGTQGGGGGGGDFDREVNMFTWAEYDDLDLLNEWGQVNLTIFNSNEEAIQKLVQGGGSSGFDMVVPTGAYIPQMVAAKLLLPLDKSKIPNFVNLDPVYADQSWDPGNTHSVCKNWGSTGWLYDTTVVTTPINTWADFIAAAQGEASGLTSILDTPPNLCGMYFWANGIDWTTENPDHLDACEEFLVNEFASHIKKFDSYPGINLSSGSYVLSMAWNGDARQGLVGVEESGGDLAQYKWGLGAPETELWMDNWCILQEADNVDAAHDFINFIMEPANSLRDLEFHGFNTGLIGVEELAADVSFRDMIFFTDDENARLRAGAVNSAQDRLVEIYSNVKAAAGG